MIKLSVRRQAAGTGMWLLGAATVLASATAASAGPMEQQELYTPPESRQEIHPRLESMLSEALDQPRKLTRIRALTEIGQLGFEGQAPKVIQQVDSDANVVVTTALKTLRDLDARSAADRLVQLLRDGGATPTQIRLADGMLSRWGERRAVELWRDRVANKQTPITLQRSAALALGRTPGDPAQPSAELMRTVVLDPQRPNAVRLAAADALSQIAGQSDTSLALDTAADLGESSFPALLAARALQSAEGERGIEQLQKRAAHGESAVQHIAMRRLHEIDPELLWPRAETALGSPDPRVRLVNVRSLETRRQESSVGWLTESLNDPHPEVRNEARRMLLALSEHEPLLDPIKSALRSVIDQGVEEKGRDEPPHWRAAEQAALLLGTLDDEPVADRLVQLFQHSRREVRVATVIALRELKVAATREPMHRFMQDISEQLPQLRQQIGELDDPTKQREAVDRWRAQSAVAAEVAQTLGVWDVQEADAVLRKFVPKSFQATPDARGSAVWALGLLHAGEPDEQLASQLVTRLFDLNPLNPEAGIVRRNAAEAIGRMKAESKLSDLRSAMGSNQQGLEVRSAARWAIMQITGEEVAELEAPVSREVGYFLSPYEKD